MDDASLLKVDSGGLEHDFHIGLATIRGTSGVTASGRVDVALVTAVDLGDDLKIGVATNEGGNANVTGMGNFNLIGDFRVADDLDVALSLVRGEHSLAMGTTHGGGEFARITNLDIGGDLGIGRNYYFSSSAAPFPIRHDSTVGFESFRDIGEVHVGGNVEVGTATVDFQLGAANVTSELLAIALFERINSMTVEGSLAVGEFRGTQESSLVGFENVTGGFSTGFVEVAQVSIGGAVNVGVLDLDATTGVVQLSARYQPQAQLAIEYSRMTTGDTMSIGVLAGSANVASAAPFGELIMAGGTLRTPAMRVAIAENPAAAGSVNARVELFVGSMIDTESLIEGEDGSIEFHLSGLERSTLGTFDGTLASLAGVYSAIDAADALLEGDIISDFDFIPPSPGTYSFDLVVTDSLTALDDISANLLIQDCPPGFCILFYGVAQEAGHDILRLTISTNCIPEPTSAALMLFWIVLALIVGTHRRAIRNTAGCGLKLGSRHTIETTFHHVRWSRPNGDLRAT